MVLKESLVFQWDTQSSAGWSSESNLDVFPLNNCEHGGYSSIALEKVPERAPEESGLKIAFRFVTDWCVSEVL